MPPSPPLQPIASKAEDSPLHVRINPPEGGREHAGFAKYEEERSISLDQLNQPLDRGTPAGERKIEDRLRLILGL